MLELSPNARVCRSDEPVSAAVEREIVMLSHEQGKYFHLNSVAASIWDLLAEPTSVAEICASLERRYQISSQDCRSQVLEFLGELDARSLLTVAG